MQPCRYKVQWLPTRMVTSHNTMIIQYWDGSVVMATVPCVTGMIIANLVDLLISYIAWSTWHKGHRWYLRYILWYHATLIACKLIYTPSNMNYYKLCFLICDIDSLEHFPAAMQTLTQLLSVVSEHKVVAKSSDIENWLQSSNHFLWIYACTIIICLLYS